MPPKREVTASTMPGHASDRPTSACRPEATELGGHPLGRAAVEVDHGHRDPGLRPAGWRVASPIPDPPPVTIGHLARKCSHRFPRLRSCRPAPRPLGPPAVTLPGTWGILGELIAPRISSSDHPRDPPAHETSPAP